MEDDCLNLTLASSVRYYRWQRKLTQEGLARMLGCTRQWVSAVEQGRVTLNAKHVENLIRVLDVPVKDLLLEHKFEREYLRGAQQIKVKINRTNV